MQKPWVSTVLTVLGGIGVVGTAVLAVKSTPKAIRILEEAEKEKGEELTKWETIKTAAPSYIPAIAVGVSTLLCIFGANALNHRSQAAMASAYALLDNSYKQYKKKTEELYGEESTSRIVEEIAKEAYEEDIDEVPEGEQLFFDMASLRYFSAKYEDVVSKAVMEDGVECYIISTPYSSDMLPWIP